MAEHLHAPLVPALRTRHPQARCWSCGTTEIASLCSWCHRFLCRQHDAVVDPSRLRRYLRRIRPGDLRPGLGRTTQDTNSGQVDPKAVPAPNDDPGAPKRVQERHFCQDCKPGRLHDPEPVTAIAAGLLGGVVAAWQLAAGLALVGLGAISVLVWVVRRGPWWIDRRSTALFLDPRVTQLEMLETMSGNATLDAQHRYRREVTDVQGIIKVTAVWARTHTAKVNDHRRRHRIPGSEDLEINSGALVVRGPGKLRLHAGDAGRLAHPTTVLLRPRAGDHPTLRTPDGRGDPRWQFELAYDLAAPEGGWQLPVWLLPSISPGSDRRALDLEVQWRTDTPGEASPREAVLESKRIERLRVCVPATWGDVVSTSDAELVAIGRRADGWRTIEWRKPPIGETSRGRCHLSVAFEQQIEPEGSVTGELDMRFHRMLSGAERIQVHAAGGARRRDGARCTTETRVRLDFDLSLAAVRYQDVRIVPDPLRDESGQGLQTFTGVVPDPQTVAQLTNILSDEGYYLKRVVENPPQPGRTAGVLNRFWDIAGRHYRGVHPVDFHLVLTGEEIEAEMPTEPTTTVRLAVRGTYATEEMEQRIVREHDLLRRRIASSLTSIAAGSEGTPPREPDEPIDAAGAELGRLRNVALSVRDHLATAARDGALPGDLAEDLVKRIDDEFGLDDLSG